MGISLTDLVHTPATVAQLASKLMAEPVLGVEPISQGANSRVFRLSSASGNYVMKFYFQHPHDLRDRLGTEFKSLSFLWAQGVYQIPQPIKSWPQHSCALYALIEGASPAGALTEVDIVQAVDFLKTLKDLTKIKATKEFAPASEAFFCAKDIVNNLRGRLKRFNLEDDAHENIGLREYIKDDFLPLLENVETWSKEFLVKHGGRWEQDLSQPNRTLSSSDFGFHNALRLSDGKIVFLDFEYFGWDDPVKTVSDFLWHPAMSLSQILKNNFVSRTQVVFDLDLQFQERLKAFFPLFGLKWCLILLNEFVPSDIQRRSFAGGISQDKTAVRLKQLSKARVLSEQIKCSYKEFNYGK